MAGLPMVRCESSWSPPALQGGLGRGDEGDLVRRDDGRVDESDCSDGVPPLEPVGLARVNQQAGDRLGYHQALGVGALLEHMRLECHLDTFGDLSCTKCVCGAKSGSDRKE